MSCDTVGHREVKHPSHSHILKSVCMTNCLALNPAQLTVNISILTKRLNIYASNPSSKSSPTYALFLSHRHCQKDGLFLLLQWKERRSLDLKLTWWPLLFFVQWLSFCICTLFLCALTLIKINPAFREQTSNYCNMNFLLNIWIFGLFNLKVVCCEWL